jgi:glycosyltransferase involved in cell wall biosynthesis
MTKNIAILIPSYNSTSTLEATLRSILSLGEDLDEHIDHLLLCDDGSRDDTVALAERSWTHPRVRLVVKRSQVNRGEYGNVNSGIAAMPSHIAWVLLMHSDNEALTAWIKVLARECGRVDDRVATICGSWEYLSDGKITDSGDSRGPDYIEDVPGDTASIRRTLFEGCWWHNGACAIRVSAWKDIGGHPQDTPLLRPLEILGLRQPPVPPTLRLRVKGDWDTMLRMLSSGYTIRYVGTPLIRYIEFHSSVSRGSFAWHGDLLESLQVIRRHQSVLKFGEIAQLHWFNLSTLICRFSGAVVRGHWRRAWFAVSALPIIATSFIASTATLSTGTSGKLNRIPFAHGAEPGPGA